MSGLGVFPYSVKGVLPRVEDIDEALQVAKRFGCTSIIAIGGGTVMEVAKGTTLIYNNAYGKYIPSTEEEKELFVRSGGTSYSSETITSLNSKDHLHVMDKEKQLPHPPQLRESIIKTIVKEVSSLSFPSPSSSIWNAAPGCLSLIAFPTTIMATQASLSFQTYAIYQPEESLVPFYTKPKVSTAAHVICVESNLQQSMNVEETLSMGFAMLGACFDALVCVEEMDLNLFYDLFRNQSKGSSSNTADIDVNVNTNTDSRKKKQQRQEILDEIHNLINSIQEGLSSLQNAYGHENYLSDNGQEKEQDKQIPNEEEIEASLLKLNQCAVKVGNLIALTPHKHAPLANLTRSLVVLFPRASYSHIMALLLRSYLIHFATLALEIIVRDNATASTTTTNNNNNTQEIDNKSQAKTQQVVVDFSNESLYDLDNDKNEDLNQGGNSTVFFPTLSIHGGFENSSLLKLLIATPSFQKMIKENPTFFATTTTEGNQNSTNQIGLFSAYLNVMTVQSAKIGCLNDYVDLTNEGEEEKEPESLATSIGNVLHLFEIDHPLLERQVLREVLEIAL